MPIFYSALLLTGVNLLLRLVSTSFGVYISARIGAAGVGLLQLALSIGSLAMTAGMAGVRTATMYLTAGELGKKRPGNIKWILSACVRYSILCSCAVSLLLIFFAPQLAQHWIGDARIVNAIRLFAFFLPVVCLCGVMSGYFTAANRIGTLAAVEIAEQMCTMVVTISALAFFAGDDPARACQAVILGSGIGACFSLSCLVFLRLRQRAKSGPAIRVRRRLLQTAVPLALADDLRSGISTAENLMVPKRLALCPAIVDPLAAFGTITGMVFPVLMFPAAILFGLAELLIPELARCNAAGSQKRIRYLCGQCLRVALLYGCCFGGLMYLLAEPLCIALFDSAQAGILLRRFSLLIPMLYCDAITDAMTKGLGEQRACVRYNILTSCMDVALLFILLPRYGMDGYFFSLLITHLINFILSLRRLFKTAHFKLSLKDPLCSFAAVLGALLAASFVQAPLVSAGAFAGIFICLLFLMDIVSKEDLLWLKGLIRP